MFNDERRKNASFIFQRMKKLYPTFETPDEVDIGAWVKVLDGYSQTEILKALTNYRASVPYNVAPIPAKFKEYLPEKHQAEQAAEVPQAKCVDFAWAQMNRDIEAGSCRNNLYVYRDAERIILEDWLVRELPIAVWREMSYLSKVKVATEKGLFANFSEALRQAAQKRFGRDYEFLGANELKALKDRQAVNDGKKDYAGSLAAHWKVGAA